jgi:hypothetical protein
VSRTGKRNARSTGKLWLPSHTAKMAALAGHGLTDEQIGRALGFTRRTVQRRRSLMGIDNSYRQRESLLGGRCNRRRAMRLEAPREG